VKEIVATVDVSKTIPLRKQQR